MNSLIIRQVDHKKDRDGGEDKDKKRKKKDKKKRKKKKEKKNDSSETIGGACPWFKDGKCPDGYPNARDYLGPKTKDGVYF